MSTFKQARAEHRMIQKNGAQMSRAEVLEALQQRPPS